MDTHDRHSIERIFAQQLIPGIDQQEILLGLEQTHSLLHTAADDPRSNARQKTVRLHLELLIDRAYKLLVHPESNHDKDAVREIIDVAQQVYLNSDENTELRIVFEANENIAKRAQSEGITVFSHIPYGFVSGERASDISAALGTKITPQAEKMYHVHPQVAGEIQSWNLSIIGAQKAWRHSKGEGISVGIVDTGCDYKHPEIRDRFESVKGYNFVNNTQNPDDDNGHGTHVAGTVAGRTSGVAPEATLYALKFLGASGGGRETDFLRAGEWAINHRVDILNGSFGSGRASAAEKALCDEFAKRGILFAAAAGNNGTTQYSYPASYDSVISVAAVDENKKHARFSQQNDQVAISAPGVQVPSAWPGGGLRRLSGTSMATPHIAGCLALLCSVGNNGGAWDVLSASAEGLGDKNYFGSGLCRPDKAFATQEAYKRWAS